MSFSLTEISLQATVQEDNRLDQVFQKADPGLL